MIGKFLTMIYKLIFNKINNKTNLYTPLVMTKQIEKALHLAEIMFLDLPENGLVKNFIIELSQRPIKVTGSINSEGYLRSNLNFSWDTDLNSFKLYNYYSAGIYLFTHTLTGLQYIGSTMNFQSRVHAHQSDSRNPSTKFHRFVSESTWKDFNFGTLYETTSYLTEFKCKYPRYVLSQGEMIILSHLSQLETRVLEQSLLTKFSPQLNSDQEVSFSYSSWNPSTLDQAYNIKHPSAKIIEVKLDGLDSILTTYASIRKAAEGLGVSNVFISRYLNKSSSFESKLLELQVTVNTPNSTIDNTPVEWPKDTSKKYPLIDYDISSLQDDYIHALSSDKSRIEYKFRDLKSVIETLYPTRYKLNLGKDRGRYISNYYNLERLVETELGKFYFVMNLDTFNKHKSKSYGNTKLVWVIDLATGLALRFDSYVLASNYLEMKYTDLVVRHIDKFTIYKNKYQFLSHNKFLELFPNAINKKYQCDLSKLPLKF